MNNTMKNLQLSPLYPLKGRFAPNRRLSKLAVITPLRGLGVSSNNSIN